MTTILNKVEITGNSLMKNQECCVQILPSKDSTGKKIRFFVEKSTEPIILDVDSVIATDHCIVLGNKSSKVMLTEHFTAACAILGVDALDVYVSKPELPILDGSAKIWVELLKSAGIEKAKKQEYTISEPVSYLNGKTHLVIIPDKELSITYAVNYDHPDLKNTWVSLDKKNLEELLRFLCIKTEIRINK